MLSPLHVQTRHYIFSVDEIILRKVKIRDLNVNKVVKFVAINI